MSRAISRLLCVCSLFAATGPLALQADETDKDNKGERIREGILNYLDDLRAKKGELNGTDGHAKAILATDARIKDLKAAKIERAGARFNVDIWEVDTKTGTFHVLLTNATSTDLLIFEGSATAKDGAVYRLKLERVLRAHEK